MQHINFSKEFPSNLHRRRISIKFEYIVNLKILLMLYLVFIKRNIHFTHQGY